jgi:hypothetical protein
MPLSLINEYHGRWGTPFSLAGTFVDCPNGLSTGHSPKPLYEKRITMTENEVKHLSKIKCELRFSEGNSGNR